MGYGDKDTVGDSDKDEDGDMTDEVDTLADGRGVHKSDGLVDTEGRSDCDVVDSYTIEVWSGVGYA